ncbi:hypothetical protein SK128_010788 [Halocaridina rubra]|uniref:Uncharacterized protein n=1 Tax=Halocaridina rubra TaxID=373956 RepID=A0AAN8WVB6_HALRR
MQNITPDKGIVHTLVPLPYGDDGAGSLSLDFFNAAKQLTVKVQESEVLKSEGEIYTEDHREDTVSEEFLNFPPNLTPDITQSDLPQDTISCSEVSVAHNDSYSSGDATAVSSEYLEALRQENARLLSRLGNLGSFSLLKGDAYSSSSQKSSSH